MRFESFVNSERCKTVLGFGIDFDSLRALLIQKDVKLGQCYWFNLHSLRALLIQKDVKQSEKRFSYYHSLRALLIQKDVKQKKCHLRIFTLFESFVNSERCKTFVGRV